MHIINELLSIGYRVVETDELGLVTKVQHINPTSKDIRAAKTIFKLAERVAVLEAVLAEHGIIVESVNPLMFNDMFTGEVIDV